MSKNFKTGMRDVFFEQLHTIFQNDPNAVFITADNGAPTLDVFATDFPDRYFTVGIAEQQMIGMAAGLALEGKKVYCYAIMPFITQRVFEQIRLDVCGHNLPITLIGIGAGLAYDIMGITHHSLEDMAILRTIPNLTIWSPSDSTAVNSIVEASHKLMAPQYIRFDRMGVPEVYSTNNFIIEPDMTELVKGTDIAIITTGIMADNALQISKLLKEKGLNVGVIDVVKIKPINSIKLANVLLNYKSIVTLEEGILAGGLGSLVLETISDLGNYKPTKRFGINDHFVFENGGRHHIWNLYGLTPEKLSEEIYAWNTSLIR